MTEIGGDITEIFLAKYANALDIDFVGLLEEDSSGKLWWQKQASCSTETDGDSAELMACLETRELKDARHARRSYRRTFTTKSGIQQIAILPLDKNPQNDQGKRRTLVAYACSEPPGPGELPRPKMTNATCRVMEAGKEAILACDGSRDLSVENRELRRLLSQRYPAKELLLICNMSSLALVLNLVAWWYYDVFVIHPLLSAVTLLGTTGYGLLALWRQNAGDSAIVK